MTITVWISLTALILGTIFGALGAVFWTANTALMKASELSGRMDVLEKLALAQGAKP